MPLTVTGMPLASEALSDGVMVTMRWFGGQSVPGATLSVPVGAVLSTRTTSVFSALALPALSVAKYAIVLEPSAETTIVAVFPFTVVGPDGPPAPTTLYVMDLTPLPPSLSVAVSVTVTLLLFQPAGLGAGEAAALTSGAVASPASVSTSTPVPRKPTSMLPRPEIA